MKTLQKILYAGLCLALAVSMAACSKEPEAPSSSQPESSAASAVSSMPEAESSRFVPADDLIPSSTVEEGSFEDLFSQNPIDKKYDEDYALASSFSMMRQACDTAARSWRDMIDTAYQAALEATSEDEKNALRREQEDWETELDDRISAIREEAGDGNEGVLTSSKQIVLLYRERAMELCRIKYEADGSLPEFPSADSAGSVG